MMLNPNCSECIFTLKGMTRDDAIAALAAIGIIEVTIPITSSHDGTNLERKYIADVDNELLPNFKEPGNGNLDIEEWADGIAIHGQMNLYDYAYPTMFKIQEAFPRFRWEDINGSDVEDFLQWCVREKPVITSVMDDVTRKIRDEHVVPKLDAMIKPVAITERLVMDFISATGGSVVCPICGVTQATDDVLASHVMERHPERLIERMRDMATAKERETIAMLDKLHRFLIDTAPRTTGTKSMDVNGTDCGGGIDHER